MLFPGVYETMDKKHASKYLKRLTCKLINSLDLFDTSTVHIRTDLPNKCSYLYCFKLRTYTSRLKFHTAKLT